jgi:hypothetical protein
MDESTATLFEQLRCLKGSFEERKACRAACTVDTCPLVLSYWGYRPNIAVNAAFAATFVVFMTIVLVQGVWTRRFKKYTAVMFIGTIMEIIGYVARLYAYSYPFSDVSSFEDRSRIIILTMSSFHSLHSSPLLLSPQLSSPLPYISPFLASSSLSEPKTLEFHPSGFHAYSSLVMLYH